MQIRWLVEDLPKSNNSFVINVRTGLEMMDGCLMRSMNVIGGLIEPSNPQCAARKRKDPLLVAQAMTMMTMMTMILVVPL